MSAALTGDHVDRRPRRTSVTVTVVKGLVAANGIPPLRLIAACPAAIQKGILAVGGQAGPAAVGA